MYIYIYIRYAQSFYLLRKTSLEAKKISFRARHLYLLYLRDTSHVGLCKRLQVPTKSTEKILGPLVSMRITWYTDVSECKGREFNVCRNSVWNATYVKYQNSVGSWLSPILDQRENLMSWPKYFVCSQERFSELQFKDSVFIQGCLVEGIFNTFFYSKLHDL